jgi:hypothetical protein
MRTLKKNFIEAVQFQRAAQIHAGEYTSVSQGARLIAAQRLHADWANLAGVRYFEVSTKEGRSYCAVVFLGKGVILARVYDGIDGNAEAAPGDMYVDYIGDSQPESVLLNTPSANRDEVVSYLKQALALGYPVGSFVDALNKIFADDHQEATMRSFRDIAALLGESFSAKLNPVAA